MKKICILLATLLLTACSSAPKRSMQVSTIYSSAAEMIESANGSILTGEYEKAAFFLTAAENQAMSIDNYDLLSAVALARCSLCLSYNPPKIEQAENQVALAQSYIKNCTNPVKQKSIVELSKVRVEVAKAGLDQYGSAVSYTSLLSKLEENKKGVKGDPYYETQFVEVSGDVYKLGGKYADADKAYTAAAKGFTDNRYLSEIGICWYKAAQVRSLGGNKDSALAAMEQAIYYDRAAENSMALGTDYYAVGLILLKGNPNSTEKQKAIDSFNHSADIFTSIKTEDLAKRSREAANGIQ
ncbi:MAG: hypothetical protein IKR45_00575 [Treponema sp.]|nr:hypothetical protein [Treponema sp.]